MLFSATQTEKIDALSKLALKKEPIYVGVDDNKETATVSGLEQGYIVCPSEKRLLVLFTFLKKNRKKKVMVFFSSCMSVKYHHELFNYIDLPVTSIHVSKFYEISKQISLNIFSFLRVNKNKQNAPPLSSNSAMLPKVYCYVQMLLLVAWTFLKLIGLYNSILQMIQKYELYK